MEPALTTGTGTRTSDMFVRGYPLLRYVLQPAIRRGIVHVNALADAAATTPVTAAAPPQQQTNSNGSKINYHPDQIDDAVTQEVQNWAECFCQNDEVFHQLSRTMHAMDDAKQRKSKMSKTPHSGSITSNSSNKLLDSRVWFLGTGSAIPGVYRNVTGIFVQVPHPDAPAGLQLQGRELGPRAASAGYTSGCSSSNSDSSSTSSSSSNSNSNSSAGDFRGALLDCGEGSWQQLMKMYSHQHPSTPPATLARHMIARIGVVWVSHPHADHHLGLIQLLLQRAKLREYLQALGRRGEEEGRGWGNGGRGVDVTAGAGASRIAPMVIVAPPEVLAFIDAYAVVDPMVAGTSRVCYNTSI